MLHDWDDERCLEILGRVRAAMLAGATLVLIEQEQERDTPEPFASWVDLHMHTQCDGGRERSVPELQDLLRRVRLRPEAVVRTAGQTLVEGRAP